jgi:DNA-binding NtrC family response regulator
MRIASKKILLVHNNTEERGRLGIMLSRFGHEVRFSSGNGCPDKLSQDNDLVIIDEKLSGQSGFEFLKQISSKQYEKVIFLSSMPFAINHPMEEINFNIYECITKPIEPLKLAVVVCDFFVEAEMHNALPL